MAFVAVGISCNKAMSDKTKEYYQSIELTIVILGYVGRYRPSGWGPHDHYNKWLKTLGEMKQNSPQSHRCIHSLSSTLPRISVFFHTHFITVFSNDIKNVQWFLRLVILHYFEVHHVTFISSC